MADPLSIGASIIAFIQLSDSVIRMCKDCIEAIKDAPKDMQMIIGEVTSLKAIIESFGAAGLHINTIRLVPSLFDATGPVRSCQRCLLALQALLPLDLSEASKGKLRRITFAELAWPMKQSKARKLLAEISRHKSTLLLAITGDMVHDIKDIRAGVQRLEFTITESQRQVVIRWLETVNPSSLHNAAFKKHEEHTSAWLLQSPKWSNWLNREKLQNFLWIHGIPGSGKTVLASFIIEQLKALCSQDSELGRVYYYCHYSHNHDEGASFLRWTIGQLCRHAKWIPAQLKELHDHGCEPSVPELENALEAVLEKFKMTYVVIDAVDESTPRDGLLAVIAAIAVDKRFRNIKVLATSREYVDIERMFSGISEAISMSNPLVERDIRLFVHSRLLSSPRIRRFQHLLNQIEDVLVTRAQGMFRWAECQIYAIERLRHESQVLAALKDLPKDLAETYIRIFESIPEADRDFVRRIFIWISGHAGGLWMKDAGIDADLLVSAVSYDLAKASPGSGAFVYDCDDLRELCGCLITFSPEAKKNREGLEAHGDGLSKDQKKVEHNLEQTAKQANLVSLAHYTVMEFLVSPLILTTLVFQFALHDGVTIFNEFALSCLQQALCANPEGKSIDWERDREAYCLTLVCAFGLRFDYFADRPDIQDLLIQYYDPTKSHFARLPGIQDLIIRGQGVCQNYLLRRLPVLRNAINTLNQVQLHAATMLNLLCVAQLKLVPRFIEGKNTKELLKARLSFQAHSLTTDGTIPDILSQHARYSKGLRWLLRNYGIYVDATRLLMDRVGSHFGSGCKHQNTANIFCIFSELLTLRVDPNGSRFKVTPLQLAVYRCDYNAVKILLDYGADPNALGAIDGEEFKNCQPTLVRIASSCTLLQILKMCGNLRKARGIKIERLLIASGGRDSAFEVKTV